MRYLKSIFTILLAIVALCPLKSDGATRLPETDLLWKNVALEGRASVTHSMLLDSRGVMWIGTNNGILFYDGNPVADTPEGIFGDI